MPAPSFPDFELSTDSEIQACLAELRNSVQSTQSELEARRQEMEMEAVAPQVEEAPATPQISPERRAEFERIEAELGLPMEQQGLQLQPGNAAHTIIHAAETLTAAVQAQPRRNSPEAEPQRGKELQWFYVRDAQRMGPVNQSQLLDLLEQGELQWNVLVWNKKLSDWIKASESELIDFSDGPPPPPIPSTTPAAKNQTGKEQKCKACGRVNGPDDRFCAGCGKPLRSTRK
jgi:hypothetical protein